MATLSPIARRLAETMSDHSEEFWCAGWMTDIEYAL